MALPTIFGTGTLVADVEQRYSKDGKAVANFRLAFNQRRYNRQTQEWEDGDATFLPCTVWGEAAENLWGSVSKGDRVNVVGRLAQRQYETKDGETRTVYELNVDEVGPSVKFATAKAERTPRGGGLQQQGAGQADPWGSSPTGGFGAQQDEEPPF